MDIKKSISKVFGGKQQGHVPVLLGNWVLEMNAPYGFVIRNSQEKQEYHFLGSSNGWITGRDSTNKKNPTVLGLNAHGYTGFTPVLVDAEATQKSERMRELQTKKQLTPEEQQELLKLGGLRK